jgi:hypothetical protein
MDIQTAHDACTQLTHAIQARGINGRAELNLNALYTQGIKLQLRAYEKEYFFYDNQWKRSADFDHPIEELEQAFDNAWGWVSAIPSEESRARDEILRQINEFRGKLPSDSRNAVLAKCAEQISDLLNREAERIAHNALTYQPGDNSSPWASDVNDRPKW